MQKVKSYKEWSNISDKERKKEIIHWNVYAGEGRNIVSEVIEEMRKQYKLNKDVLSISFGLYHGGLWIISVDVKKGSKTKIPLHYKGFPIIKRYKDSSG